MEKLADILNSTEVFALLEDSKSPAEQANNLLFTKPQAEIIARTETDIPEALEQIEQCREKGWYLCGYLAYEAGYTFIDRVIERRFDNHKEQALIHFVAFQQKHSLSRAEIDAAFNELVINPTQQLCAHGFNLNVSEKQYLNAIDKIKRYIQAGDTYQINYTIKFKFRLRGKANALYRDLRQTQPVEFGALLHFPELKVISLSPELFVKKHGNTLVSKPMKGTAKRGSSKKQDTEIVDFLKNDPKTLSENVMIVDLIRNDFGRICEIGSVKVSNLFEVQTFKTVHQMISTVTGKLKSNIPFAALLRGLFPCGSITGAPKVRTMEIINELETEARGIYTGAIGYILPNNDFYFNVPIRTIVMNPRNHCEMGIGSGIIHESDAKAEFEECILKADFLTNLNDNFYLIETLKYDAKAQIFSRLEAHLYRLKDSAGYFGFRLKQAEIDNKLSEIKHKLIDGEYKIRLCAFQNGDITVNHEALPPASENTAPKSVCIGKAAISSRSIFQYHKTSRREVYNAEYERASQAGYYDAIILNEHGEVAEACRHNVFIRKGKQLITPPIDAGVLHGVYRQHLIDTQAIIERSVSLKDLQDCDEILLCNSVRGLVSVKLSLAD